MTMLYAQVNLADHTLVGSAGPLPEILVGLPDSAVADISAVCTPPPPGMEGQGWWPVRMVMPAYDAATQIPDGTYTSAPDVASKTVISTPTIRPLTAAELAANLATAQAAKSAATDAKRDTILTGGFAHDFGGAIGTKVLQTRESDETNWLTLQNSCLAAVMAGQGATAGAVIRTTDNVNVPLTYGDCLQVLLAMAAWGAAVYARSWTLKDTIAGAPNQAALDAVDIMTGWPPTP